jgi:hypothetical protein
MASPANERIRIASKKVAQGRLIIARQQCIIDIKREAGLDVGSSINALAELQKSQLFLEVQWEQLLREEDRRCRPLS